MNLLNEILNMLNHPMFWLYVFASATGYIIVKAIPTIVSILLYLVYGAAWVLGRITFYTLFMVLFVWEVLKLAYKKAMKK